MLKEMFCWEVGVKGAVLLLLRLEMDANKVFDNDIDRTE